MAKGFLKEAEQDLGLKRWRSCVDNSQLAIENSGKTIIAIYVPVEKTHDPSRQLTKMLKENIFPTQLSSEISAAIKILGQFGVEEHFMTDYGDEASGKDPWEIFTEDNANDAIKSAQQANVLAQNIYGLVFQEKKPL